MHELAVKTGQTVEAISSLEAPARKSGTSLDQVAVALQRLSKNMLEAAETGKGNAAKAFEELGIQVTDSEGRLRSSAEVMQEVAEKLEAMDDRTRAVALRQEIFGKSSQNVAGILHELADGHKLTATVTTEQAEAAHELEAKMQELELRSTNLARQFSLGLVPSLNAVAAAMEETADKTDAAREAGQVFGTIFTYGAKVLAGFYEFAVLMCKSLATMVATFDLLKTGNVTGALAAMKEGFADISQTAFNAGEMIRKMGEETQKLPAPKHSAAASGGTAPAGALAAAAAAVAAGGGGEEAAGTGSESGGGASFAPAASAGGAAGGVSSVVVGAKSLNNVLKDTKVLGTDLGTILERAGIKGVRSMSDLKNVARNVAAELINMGKTPVMQWLSGTVGPSVSGFFSGAGSSSGADSAGDVSDFFAGYYAKGGDIPSGMVGIAGENGPELIRGPASVTPMNGLGGGGDVSIDGGNSNVTNHFNFNISMPGGSSDAMAAVSRLQSALPGMIERVSIAAAKRYWAQRGMAYGS
jgi:hypothetical protein